MKKPHQHFIPRTYLEKFAHRQDGDKFFVSAFNKLTDSITNEISVKDICVETDLYTLKHLSGNEKYKIEDFFSENIESKYPDVYKLLVLDKKEYISGEERTLILYTTLSMYFRTPKVLNKFVHFAATLVDDVKNNTEADKIDFLGYEISIKDKSFNEIKKEIKEQRRIDYLKTQIALLNQFIRFKALDGIVVTELVGDQEFVTSDNPVEIRNSFGTGFNLFDARNSIYVPLDPKHALFIPPKLEGSIINRVFYQRDSFFQHVILNNCVYENAERWVVGTQTGIDKFLKDQAKYTKPAEKDDPLIRKFKTKLVLMQTMVMLAEKGVTKDNKELIDFMRNIQKHELYAESIEFQDTVRQLKEMGLDV
jgi:hypothetical protein